MTPQQLHDQFGRLIEDAVWASGCAEWRREDMRGVASLAFARALEKYNPAQAATFPAYLVQRMKWDIIDAMRREGRCRTTSGKLTGSGVGVVCLSLDTTDAEGTALMEIEDEAAPSPSACVALDAGEAVALLPHLNPNQRAIVERYVMRGELSQSVGLALGFCKARVSQIRRRALARLRALLHDREPAAAPHRPVVTDYAVTLIVRHEHRRARRSLAVATMERSRSRQPVKTPPTRVYRVADAGAVREALAMVKADPALALADAARQLGCSPGSLRVKAGSMGVDLRALSTARRHLRLAKSLHRWCDRGCSVAAFCADEGITTQAFYQQRSRLRRLTAA